MSILFNENDIDILQSFELIRNPVPVIAEVDSSSPSLQGYKEVLQFLHNAGCSTRLLWQLVPVSSFQAQITPWKCWNSSSPAPPMGPGIFASGVLLPWSSSLRNDAWNALREWVLPPSHLYPCPQYYTSLFLIGHFPPLQPLPILIITSKMY